MCRCCLNSLFCFLLSQLLANGFKTYLSFSSFIFGFISFFLLTFCYFLFSGAGRGGWDSNPSPKDDEACVLPLVPISLFCFIHHSLKYFMCYLSFLLSLSLSVCLSVSYHYFLVKLFLSFFLSFFTFIGYFPLFFLFLLYSFSFCSYFSIFLFMYIL
jgi:hypothetical protein